jgi:ArsR family transcriptional regulator
VLREVGLITGERRGTWVYCRAVPDVMRQLSAVLMPAEQPVV